MVFKRLKAEWLMLSAVALTVLLAITLLAAGPIYADAAFLAGVQRTLADAPPEEANVTINARVPADRLVGVDRAVRDQVQAMLPAGVVEVRRITVSGPLHLASGEGVASFRVMEGLHDHIALVDGSWPAQESIEAMVHEIAADALGLAVGDTVTVQPPGAGEASTVTISGIYRVGNPQDIYWLNTPLEIDGVSGSSVTTFGPFVVTSEAFQVINPSPAQVQWRVFPQFNELSVDELLQVRRTLVGLETRINREIADGPTVSVETSLGTLLRETERSLLATRSGILILSLQLAVLAAYALVLIAGLRVSQRRPETILLRSRGAGVGHLGRMATTEAALIVLPCVAIAPWLAALTLRGLNNIQPLSDIGMTLRPQVGRDAYLIAIGAGIACIALLVVPALRSARSAIDDRGSHGRPRLRGFFQSSGVDIALLLIAAGGFFQLRQYGSPVTATVDGELQIDPYLVMAPALAMLAGALLTLRLIPRLASLVEFGALQRIGLVSALGGWQVGRRAGNYARAGLLLVLALCVGLFSLAFMHTWQVSQADQADFQVGADIRVQPRATSRIHPGWLPAAYTSLDGVDDIMPYNNQIVRMPIRSEVANVVLIDSARADRIVRFREDLAEEPIEDLMSDLTAGRPEIPSIVLPGEPAWLAIDVRAELEPLCPGVSDEQKCRNVRDLPDEEVATFELPLTPAIVVRDAAGGLRRIEADPLAGMWETERVIFNLESSTEIQGSVSPSWPLELIAIEFSTLAAPGEDRTGMASIVSILAGENLNQASWVPVGLDSTVWTTHAGVLVEGASGAVPRASLVQGESLEALDLRLNTGSTRIMGYTLPGRAEYYRTKVAFGLYPGMYEIEHPIPVILSEQVLSELALGVSDRFFISILGEQHPVEVVGTVKAFPSLPETTPAIVIADWNTVVAKNLIHPGRTLRTPEEFWLAVDGKHSDNIVRQLRDAPFSTLWITVRNDRYNQLRTDPVALATIGVLALGSIVAAIFGLAGFALNALVSTRERLTEFALLRVLGLSPRQMVSTLMIEHGFLAAISLILGSALGLLLVKGVLPLITINQRAAAVFPVAKATIPWTAMAILLLAIALAVTAASGLVTLFLRRQGMGELLRIGEDQR